MLPLNTRTQVVEIWVDNQNVTTDRLLNLYTHGITNINRLSHNITVPSDSGINISDNKIVLISGEVIASSQDVGTNLVVIH